MLAEIFSDIDQTFFRPHPFTRRAAHDIANRAGRDLYAVLLFDQRPVAYGMLRGWDEGYAVPSLGIAVRSDSQGLGFGRLTMAHLHAEAVRGGATEVRLRVHERNTRARRLYESLHYEYAGEERGELVMRVVLRPSARIGSAPSPRAGATPAPETGDPERQLHITAASPVTSEVVPLVIVGAGGFGREVLELIRSINAASPAFDVLGFLDDGPASRELLHRVGSEVLGPATRLADTEAQYVIAIGDAVPRRRIDALAREHGRIAASLVHPWATVGADVCIREGAIVAAGSRLTTHVVVGRHAHINVNCTVGHDAVIADFATLFPGVHVSGGCVIEEDATLGTGSVILPDVRVGRGAAVGAGAIVVRDVAPGTVVVGSAARPTLGGRPSNDSSSG